MDSLNYMCNPERQRGAVMALAAVAMLAVVGMAGLALDLGHAYWNKTRLQNALDAAALAGAKTLSDDGSTADATTAAVATFNEHLDGEMQDLVPGIEFSQNLNPFTAGAEVPNARFVRASVDDFDMGVTLVQVLGFGPTLTVGGSAVAGPLPIGKDDGDKVCGVVPLLMCKQPGAAEVCNDTECYGYPVGAEKEFCLKSGAQEGDLCSKSDSFNQIGAGNFHLLDFDCPQGGGGACVRKQLAGEYEGCVVIGEDENTKPGNTAGPSLQGINTRFGEWSGAGMNPTDHPPDVVTYNLNDDGAFWFEDYEARLPNGAFDYDPIEDGGIGVRKRRVVAIPIGDCPADNNTVPIVTTACVYLTRPVVQGQAEIYGQFVAGGECNAGGDVPENPGSGDDLDPVKIILYNSSASEDS